MRGVRRMANVSAVCVRADVGWGLQWVADNGNRGCELIPQCEKRLIQGGRGRGEGGGAAGRTLATDDVQPCIYTFADQNQSGQPYSTMAHTRFVKLRT